MNLPFPPALLIPLGIALLIAALVLHHQHLKKMPKNQLTEGNKKPWYVDVMEALGIAAFLIGLGASLL